MAVGNEGAGLATQIVKVSASVFDSTGRGGGVIECRGDRGDFGIYFSGLRLDSDGGSGSSAVGVED